MLPAFLPEAELPPRPLLAAFHVATNVAARQVEEITQGQTAAHRQQTEDRTERGDSELR